MRLGNEKRLNSKVDIFSEFFMLLSGCDEGATLSCEVNTVNKDTGVDAVLVRFPDEYGKSMLGSKPSTIFPNKETSPPAL